MKYTGKVPLPEPVLAARDLSVAFLQGGKRTEAVRRVSFDLYPGETLALVGESGSGKSVTALSTVRLLPENAEITGSVRYRGTEMTTADQRALRTVRGNDISFIFQEPMTSLNPLHTIEKQIGESLALHQGLTGAAARTRILDLLTRVGIRDPQDRLASYPHQLSGGQRQRVMIAMALANGPDILIADEPTTALDVTVQAQVLNLLMQLREEEGMALVLISHDLAVVAEVADTVAVMYAGRVVETGGIETVYREPAHPYTHGLLGAIPRIDQVGRTLTVMSGIPPVLTSVPPGCRFHPRGRHAQEICRRSEPALQLADNGTSSACHFSRASNWTKQR